MISDYYSPDFSHSTPTCYFSIVQPASHHHFSVETPSSTPLSAYSPEAFSDPTHPLLAFRSPPISSQPSTSIMDASKFLQLQTAASHSRPTAQPMQHSSSISSNSSSGSSSSSYSPSMMPQACCSRCRRNSTSHNGMVKFGTNLYYCSHCASMVGYSAG